MLILPLKPGISYDLGTALGKWLDNNELHISFQPTNPLQFILPKPDFTSNDCRDDLLRLQSLRNVITNSILKPNSHKDCINEGILEECYEYHAVLLEFEKHGFPAVDDETTPLQIEWKSAFIPNQKEKHASLVWERCVIMYNISALLTQKAYNCSVTDRDSCKEAVGYCQQGASIVALLRELVSSQDYSLVDLCNSMLVFWEKYLLAEAQLFIYRMASFGNADNTKHSTLSFLAQSGYELFKSALTITHDPRLQSEIHDYVQEWGTYCKTVSMLCACKAQYHTSIVHRVSYEHGKEIARLRDCKSKLDKLQKFLKTIDYDTVVLNEKREVQILVPTVMDRLNEADRDNYKIYQETIPTTVPEIPSKQLSKTSASLPENMIVCKYNLFQGVSK